MGSVREAISHLTISEWMWDNICYNQAMPDSSLLPVIVGFVEDQALAAEIEKVVQNLDYRMVWIVRADQIAPPDLIPPARQVGEQVTGRSAALMEDLTLWKPALVLFDLDNAEIPWRDWVALIKSAPATRRLPVVCFSERGEPEIKEIAADAGADVTLERTYLIGELAEIVQKYARPLGLPAIVDACHVPLSKRAIEGLELFNQGHYFEAHEVLEDAWNADRTPGREVYRAIIQISVAYLHIERRNYNGAVKMFWRVRQWIDPLPGVCRGVDVAKLREDARTVHANLLALGQERIAEFDRSLLQPVIFKMP